MKNEYCFISENTGILYSNSKYSRLDINKVVRYDGNMVLCAVLYHREYCSETWHIHQGVYIESLNIAGIIHCIEAMKEIPSFSYAIKEWNNTVNQIHYENEKRE